MPWKQRQRHVLSNITKMFKKRVLAEWIRMVVIIQFVFEWFAGLNCIVLRSQIPVLPLRWRLVRILNYRNPIDTRLNDVVTFTVTFILKIANLVSVATGGIHVSRANLFYFFPNSGGHDLENPDSSCKICWIVLLHANPKFLSSFFSKFHSNQCSGLVVT